MNINKFKINKRGETFGGWFEVVMFMILFLAIMGLIGFYMNNDYEKDYDLTLGLNLTNQLNSISTFSQQSINATSQGQASATDFGVIKLSTSVQIIKLAFDTILTMLTGSFISNLVGAMNLGAYGFWIALVFRTLYVVSLIFIFLRLVLRINI